MLQLFEEDIVADSMLIGTLHLKFTVTLEKPHDTRNRLGSYPQQAITAYSVSFRRWAN
jgi:hypothetical protein